MDYELHHRVLLWLTEAGELLKEAVLTTYDVGVKENFRDLVTRYDREVEAYLVGKIQSYYPTHHIIGEEGSTQRPTELRGTTWIIDPIDGTMNFVKLQRDFAIMIGLFQGCEPVAGYIYDVMRGEMFYAIVGEGIYKNNQKLLPKPYETLSESIVLSNLGRINSKEYNIKGLIDRSLGIRGYGSAAIEILAVIESKASIYAAHHLQAWDVAAGLAFFKEFNYPVTTLKGEAVNVLHAGSVLFGHPETHREALNILNE